MGAPGCRPGVVYNRKNKGGTVRISLRELAYASVILAGLAVAGHELAGVAGATGSQVVAAGDGGYVVSGDGVVYRRGGGGGVYTTWTPVFSFGAVAARPAILTGSPDQGFGLILENGDVYDTDAGAPRLIGNVFGGAPTAVQPQTWSQIKAAHGGR